jgi:hypothetical protein
MLLTLVTQIDRVIYHLKKVKGTIFLILEGVKLLLVNKRYSIINTSSLRNVVERTFGVWKMKWRILLRMPSYPMVKQKMMIMAATMCHHNFICEYHALDRHFYRCDRDPEYIATIPQGYARYHPPQNSSNGSIFEAKNDTNMDIFRDNLARAIMQSRVWLCLDVL